MKSKVGLIGIGLMGEPMAENWINKGFEVSVLPHKNMDPANRLKSKGARICTSVQELLENSEFVILMLPTSQEVEFYALGEIRQLAKPSRHMIIDMSTSDPASTRRIGYELKKSGLDFFDAPVTGGVKGAKEGTLVLFVGGEKPLFEKARHVLEAVSRKQTHFGDLGLGHVAKAINNIICIGNLCVFSEALPLGKAMGLEMGKLVETLMEGTANSEMFKIYVPQIMAGDFQPRFKLEHAYKDLVIALRMTEFAGAELPLLEAMLYHFKNADEAGLGRENLSALIKPIEKQFRN